MNAHSTRARVLALSLCAVTACSTWRAQTAPPADILSTPRERARVTLVDGSAHDLHGTRIEGDRVVAGTFTSPLSDVRRVELREFSAGRTVGLATGVAGVLLVIGFVITKGIEDDIGDIQF